MALLGTHEPSGGAIGGSSASSPLRCLRSLAVLLEQARKKTTRVWAGQSPFDLKDALRRRGYRWSDGSDGRPRSWYVDVDESKLDDEIAFLKTEIYLRDAEPRLQTLTAFDRFSVRA
jgi:DNA polymerase III subunit epsilon